MTNIDLRDEEWCSRRLLLEARAEIEQLKAEAALWQDRYNHRAEGDGIEIERLKAENKQFREQVVALLEGAQDDEAEVERLRAAIAWTREVRPGKNPESGGAIVHMTWDEFNAMRALAKPKP